MGGLSIARDAYYYRLAISYLQPEPDNRLQQAICPLVPCYRNLYELPSMKGSFGQLCVALMWKSVKSSAASCFQHCENRNWITWWSAEFRWLGLCKVLKNSQDFFARSLCVQLWPFISASMQVQMFPLNFHHTHMNPFYLSLLNLNSRKNNKRVKCLKIWEILWLPIATSFTNVNQKKKERKWKELSRSRRKVDCSMRNLKWFCNSFDDLWEPTPQHRI